MRKSIYILGIESSCDDTAASVLKVELDDKSEGIIKPKVLSSIIINQTNLHTAFGGVVPEIAARAHSEKLDVCVKKALNEANLKINQINALAVTSGPGLIGGLLSGVMFAKGLSKGLNIPVIGVNHLAGHCLSPLLVKKITFPYLLLLVSGGHCQFITVRNYDSFKRLGGTLDDAPGEAFDKVAKILGLGYPGGPEVEQCAINGNQERFDLPRPLIDRKDCNLSFSGLKTALKNQRDLLIKKKGGITSVDRNDLCAGFQNAICSVLAKKTSLAIEVFIKENIAAAPTLAIAGGVAANYEIQNTLRNVAKSYKFDFCVPPNKLCTDNAAMIAYAGSNKYFTSDFDPLDLIPRPRWPLDMTATPLSGSGKRGPKS